MKKVLVTLVFFMLGAAGLVPAHAQQEPVVRAVMFWTEGCGHCEWVKESVLPPLAVQYGDQWQLELVELRSAEDFERLFDLGAAAGVPREQIGVPFLLIGDDVLIGSGQIPAELPGLIEQHLAAGGVGWPQAPGLEWFLPLVNEPGATVSPETAAEAAVFPATPQSAPAAPAHDGFLLAIVILVGMVLALGYTAVRFWQAQQGRVRKRAPAWVQNAVPVLAVIGLGVAAYLAYVETQAVTAVCGPVGNCNAVQSSEYAHIVGIPIGVLGVIGYIAILGAWAWDKRQGDKRAAPALVAMTTFGVLFSIFLTYLEPFVIGAVCAWCLTSAVVMTLLLLLSVETAVPQLRPIPICRTRRR